jgi:hypothetical protein
MTTMPVAAKATTLSVMAGRVPAIRPPTDRAQTAGTHPATPIEA